MIDDPTVPCQICGAQTPMLATKLCDWCWELDRRLDEALRPKSPRHEYVMTRVFEVAREDAERAEKESDAS
jgi:hypothetical protein